MVAPELQDAAIAGAANALRSRPPSLEEFFRRLVHGTVNALVESERQALQTEAPRVDHSGADDVIDAEFEVL